MGDEPKLFVQSHECVASAFCVGVAGAQVVVADTRQTRVSGLIGAGEVGVGVAQVARQVELQPLGQAHGLGDGCGVVDEPCGGLGRWSQYGVAVATSLTVGAVQRQVMADRDERVLQERTARVVGVDVAGRDGGEAQDLGQLRQVAHQGSIAAGAGPLQLDVHVARAERLDQATGRSLGVAGAVGGDESRNHAVSGTPGQTYEPGGVGVQVCGIERRRDRPPIGRWARGGVRERDQPAQVGVPDVGLDQQRQVRPTGQGQLGPGDRPDPGLLGGMCERERSREPVMIGQRHRRVPERRRLFRKLFGSRCPVQEAEPRVGVQLDVRDGRHSERMFAY